jgi:Flp pilus assembly protein TadG
MAREASQVAGWYQIGMERAITDCVMSESKNYRRGRLTRQERGSQLVELGLVLPVLTFVLFSIIQYGYLYGAYITIRNASAVGAREAIISTNTADIVNLAQAAVGPLLVPSSLTVTPTPTNINGRAGMVVKVSYPFKLMIPFVVPGRNANSSIRTITATTTIQ